MTSSKWSISLATICLAFPIFLLALDKDPAEGDVEKTSRWARIDLTQYCGKPIGELIDVLGIDADDFAFYSEHNTNRPDKWGINEGAFSLGILPTEFKYCDVNEHYMKWKMEDFLKENIGIIKVDIFENQTERMNDIQSEHTNKCHLGVEYPYYIGRTIETLIKDVGQPGEGSYVMWSRDFITHDTIYIACVFRYTNGLEMIVYFENDIFQQPNWGGRIKGLNEFMDQKIDMMTIRIICE